MVIDLLLWVTVVLLVFQLTKTSDNLGVNSCLLEQLPATFDFAKIKFVDNFYVGISTVGDLYYSFDLANWNERPVAHSNEIRDLVQTPYGDFASTRVIAVGSGTTNFYADPVINRATATASVTSGVITSINITDGGFGYRVGSSPPVIVESDATKREDLFSVDAEGDFGDIVGINTWLPGSANVLPRLLLLLSLSSTIILIWDMVILH